MESDIGSRAQVSCFRVSGQSSMAACEGVWWLSMLFVAGHGQGQLLAFQLFCPCRQQTHVCSYSRLASSTFLSAAAHIPSSSHLEPLRTLPGESKQCEGQVQPETQPCYWATAVEQQHPLPKVPRAFLENQISSKHLPKQRPSPIRALTHGFFLQENPTCPEVPAGAASQAVCAQGVRNIPASPSEA